MELDSLCDDYSISSSRYRDNVRFLICASFSLVFIVTSECPKPFYEDNQTHLCSYSDQTVLSWSEGYNQCLTEPLYGSYMEIHSIKQFEELKNIREKGSFWLGANNFGSYIYISMDKKICKFEKILQFTEEKKRVIT